ncbi:hypothetical protein VNO78_00562 [Psophocarpus tetragonolobus]|uniref:B-like cyclin n=1 Tax=Psophocarpus tetragonolobus TaxID=3891 RepID=A0AAN9XUQ2_PSOTE
MDMETWAEKRKRNSNVDAVVIVEKQHPINKRVVLAELQSLPNLILPETENQWQEKILSPKSSNVKKSSPANNTHICEPYVSNIQEYLRAMERKRRPMIDYDEIQKEVTPHMRAVLVDWLVDVADEYNFLSDTLHLSVSYIDRFLSVNPVIKSRKYEEIDQPDVDEFCDITDNTYDKTEIIKMECEILTSLNFEMGNPTVNTFLRTYFGVACEKEKTTNLKVEFLGCYLAELSLLDYDCIKFLPSVVAASVIFLARFIIRPEAHPWKGGVLPICSGEIQAAQGWAQADILGMVNEVLEKPPNWHLDVCKKISRCLSGAAIWKPWCSVGFVSPVGGSGKGLVTSQLMANGTSVMGHSSPTSCYLGQKDVEEVEPNSSRVLIEVLIGAVDKVAVTNESCYRSESWQTILEGEDQIGQAYGYCRTYNLENYLGVPLFRKRVSCSCQTFQFIIDKQCRNHRGSALGVSTINLVELWPIRHGVRTAPHHGAQNIVLEID